MKIAVIGDVLLDVDLSGTADRLSPDAPVPVVDVVDTVVRAGGAGLVARMLADDGHSVDLVTVISDDERSAELRGALGGIRIVAGASGGPTPVKTRLRADRHAVARIDQGCANPARPGITDAMVDAVLTADALVVADYGRGVAADPRLRAALEARGWLVPLVWDPHPLGATPVPSARVVTPNLAEALVFANRSGTSLRLVTEAAVALRRQWGCAAVVVTLGPRGALLCAEPRPGHVQSAPLVVPAVPVDAVDPCGAGDRLAATLAVELQAGAALPDALATAVGTASGFLLNGGVSALGAPVPVGMGAAATDAIAIAEQTRASGGTVIATGGCFDLLHAGHARTLSTARSLGDCLVVCLNSDESVRRLKGPDRPIIEEQDRVALLLALECVDAVVVFDENTPEDVLRRLRPDVWVKGGDYAIDDLPEARLMTSWGGCTVTVPYHPAHSTSLLASALARVS